VNVPKTTPADLRSYPGETFRPSAMGQSETTQPNSWRGRFTLNSGLDHSATVRQQRAINSGPMHSLMPSVARRACGAKQGTAIEPVAPGITGCALGQAIHVRIPRARLGHRVCPSGVRGVVRRTLVEHNSGFSRDLSSAFPGAAVAARIEDLRTTAFGSNLR
jgi:hypothetical protein